VQNCISYDGLIPCTDLTMSRKCWSSALLIARGRSVRCVLLPCPGYINPSMGDVELTRRGRRPCHLYLILSLAISAPPITLLHQTFSSTRGVSANPDLSELITLSFEIFS